VNKLLTQQVELFRKYLTLNLPENWKSIIINFKATRISIPKKIINFNNLDKTDIDDFIMKYNFYADAIRQQDDILLCEIMSVLLCMKRIGIIEIDSLTLRYQQFPLDINITDCNYELSKFNRNIELLRNFY
jgi:hypothetical protein